MGNKVSSMDDENMLSQAMASGDTVRLKMVLEKLNHEPRSVRGFILPPLFYLVLNAPLYSSDRLIKVLQTFHNAKVFPDGAKCQSHYMTAAVRKDGRLHFGINRSRVDISSGRKCVYIKELTLNQYLIKIKDEIGSGAVLGASRANLDLDRFNTTINQLNDTLSNFKYWKPVAIKPPPTYMETMLAPVRVAQPAAATYPAAYPASYPGQVPTAGPSAYPGHAPTASPAYPSPSVTPGYPAPMAGPMGGTPYVTPTAPLPTAPPAFVPASASKQTPGTCDRKNSTSEDDNTCIYCMDKKRSHIITPCGHQCLCADCAPMFKPGMGCPLCRDSIVSIIRVFT